LKMAQTAEELEAINALLGLSGEERQRRRDHVGKLQEESCSAAVMQARSYGHPATGNEIGKEKKDRDERETANRSLQRDGSDLMRRRKKSIEDSKAAVDSAVGAAGTATTSSSSTSHSNSTTMTSPISTTTARGSLLTFNWGGTSSAREKVRRNNGHVRTHSDGLNQDGLGKTPEDNDAPGNSGSGNSSLAPRAEVIITRPFSQQQRL
jgi:hypothetical protein